MTNKMIKNMMRPLLGAALLSVLTAAAAGNTGLAFVHGTGHHPDAAKEYWTQAMIDSVRQGLPNRNLVIVINCDFSQYMWAAGASGCLADQLYPFIVNNNITDLVVESHSNGGNVVRWLMSNPTRDSRYPAIIKAIRWVNAIAPSSLGTPLADATISGNVFESSLGWLLGYKSDAVRQQQVSWMASYNANWLYGTAGRPALPKPFYSVVGTDVDTSPLDGDSYCGGYGLNVGLEVTQAWLNSCSDGFINCSSAAGAGSNWFYDKARTIGGEPLSHNQSRRQCFGLDTILRNDL
ncbi:hypothetical protein SAMN05428948_1707 [Massilia sp. CF038]|nr:hypothetical protein SAMN05428948_1707 [Massilia sp. CF038]